MRSVAVKQADVSNRDDVAGVLDEIERSFPPLRGVFHSAAVLDDGVLLRQSWDRFARVLAPKMQGAWLLHSLTQRLSLDCFVMFSSTASVLGSAGQANYAAANAFLDALALYRRALGLPALSINWGPWSEIGVAAGRNLGDRLMTDGIGSIPADIGIQALEYLLGEGNAQVVVAPLDFSRLFERSGAHAAGSRFFCEVARHDPVGPAVRAAAASAPELPRRLEEAQPSDRKKLLHEHVHEQVIRVLGFADSFRLDPRRGLSDLGVDSLMSIELRNRLQTSTGEPLPSTLVYDFPTIATLVEFLASDVLRLDLADSAIPSGNGNGNGNGNGHGRLKSGDAISELDGLSLEEADALLLAELAQAERRRS